MTPRDKAGREIEVGDFIVYGHNLGRCAALRYGRVLAINEKEDRYNRRATLHYTVIGVRDAFRGLRVAPVLCERTGTLQFGDRILVIEPSQMPTPVWELLRDYRP